MAAFCIKAAKDHSDSCGGSTHIQTMKADGSGFIVHRIIPTEIKDSEEHSVELYQIAKELIKCLGTKGPEGDEDIKSITDHCCPKQPQK